MQNVSLSRKCSMFPAAPGQSVIPPYGATFVKILYLTDLAQKLLSLRAFSYLCAEIAISARI